MAYTDEIRELNLLISSECVDGGKLEGVFFENTILKPFHKFPFIGTKFVKLNTLNLASGSTVIESVDILVACGDILSNNDDKELDLYDTIIDKLLIAKSFIRGGITDDEIEIETTRFEGSKGAVAAIIVTIYC